MENFDSRNGNKNFRFRNGTSIYLSYQHKNFNVLLFDVTYNIYNIDQGEQYHDCLWSSGLQINKP